MGKWLEDWGDLRRKGVMGKISRLLFLQVLHEWMSPWFLGVCCVTASITCWLLSWQFCVFVTFLGCWVSENVTLLRRANGVTSNGNGDFKFGSRRKNHVENRLHLSLGYAGMPSPLQWQFLHRSWGGTKFHQVLPRRVWKKTSTLLLGKNATYLQTSWMQHFFSKGLQRYDEIFRVKE